jgi:hypothetical protein
MLDEPAPSIKSKGEEGDREEASSMDSDALQLVNIITVRTTAEAKNPKWE